MSDIPDWELRLWIDYEHLATDNSRLQPVPTKNGSGARMVISPAYKAKREAIRTLAAGYWSGGRYGGPVAAEVDVWLPPRSRLDTTNLNKCIWDALEGVVVKDDRQFVDVTIREQTRSERDRPGVRVVVRPA